MSSYENHVYANSDFPIIFHLDTRGEYERGEWAHWHESIEVLYFIEGEGKITLNNEEVMASSGDIVVVNSAVLHCIETQGMGCKYYCFIADKAVMGEMPFMSEQVTYRAIINDEEVAKYFGLIVMELEEKRENYEFAVKELAGLMFCMMWRKFRIERGEDVEFSQNTNKKIELVKSAIRFIRENYSDDISVYEVCNHVGFSVSYLCHVFKEVTGKTIVAYINFIRCSGARRLIKTGKYNVSESAILSGFNSLSYFSRTYKEIFGASPSGI